MRPSSGSDAQWAAIDDPRVTPAGRLLRCTHVDELPQLLNVLRGEMSLVGPRPEQPAVVERLERDVPFYQRRHLIRPGITGWAQIRCGYARSESGSMWKHCHDLYYLKHRSIRIDLWIFLGERATRRAWRGATDRGDHEIEGTGPGRSYADPGRRECGSCDRRRQLSGLTHMIPMPPIPLRRWETIARSRASPGSGTRLSR